MMLEDDGNGIHRSYWGMSKRGQMTRRREGGDYYYYYYYYYYQHHHPPY